MNNWLITLDLNGNLGEKITLYLPNFPNGAKFERWAKGQVNIQSTDGSYVGDFNLEYSDVSDLASQLSSLENGKEINWSAMEDGLSIAIRVSNVGKAHVAVQVHNTGSFWRSIEVEMEMPFANLEPHIDQLRSSY